MNHSQKELLKAAIRFSKKLAKLGRDKDQIEKSVKIHFPESYNAFMKGNINAQTGEMQKCQN